MSFPWVVTNDAIFVRTDRAKEYGLKVPGPDWTWDDFLALAKGYTKPDKNHHGFGMRGAGTWAVLYATEFMYGNGAQVLKDRKVAINSPEAVTAFEWYVDLIRKHKITPPSVATDGYRQIVVGFGRGVTSGTCTIPARWRSGRSSSASPISPPCPQALGPANKRASCCFSETLTMFKAAKQKDGAWWFLTWLMEDEPNYQYCTTLGLLPSRQALAERPHYKHPGYLGFVQSFPFSIVSPYLAYAGWGGKLDSEGVPAVQQALLGKISPKECLDKLAEILTKNMA